MGVTESHSCDTSRRMYSPAFVSSQLAVGTVEEMEDSIAHRLGQCEGEMSNSFPSATGCSRCRSSSLSLSSTTPLATSSMHSSSSSSSFLHSSFSPSSLTCSMLSSFLCTRSHSWILFTVLLVTICMWTTEGARIHNPTRPVTFHDTRQEEFVQSLSNYEIVHPTRVHSSGDHLSNAVHHHIAEHHRNKRWVERTASPSEEELLHYKVNIEGRDLHLALEPNHKLFAPGLVVERRVSAFGNMSDVRLHRIQGNKCHFTGEVKDNPGSKVAIATCNGLHGFINTLDEEYFIEPVKGHNLERSHVDGHPHVIYKRSALPDHLDSHHGNERGAKGTCGNDEEEENSFEKIELKRQRWQKHHVHQEHDGDRGDSTSHRRRRRSVSLERNVEVMVVVDKEMMKFYEQEDIETYVLTIMNMVANMYHDSTIGNAVNLVLVKLMLLEENPKDLKINHHADNTLNSFCKWQNTINTKDDKHPNHHDVALLLTRYNICARLNEPCSTLGLAQVSGLCQPHRSCNINEDTGLSLSYTVAHELGHNFGMQHDGTNNGCLANPDNHIHIMAPQLNARPSPIYWSNCSRESITRFLDRDWGYCTDDEPSEHEFQFPVLPPGVMYDVDHQCRLQFGPDAEFCDGIDEPCSTLWCKVNKRCVTKLEASAPGTLCGDNKWCFMNKCEVIMEKPESVDGEWGVWGEWTACSRSCGAGVSFKERHCNNPPPSKGGNYCLGERKRYRICNTDECPPEGPSFKAVQCSEFNTIPYKGQIYDWEPVSTPATPCQLHCKPIGKYFSVMLQDTVRDGTPARQAGRDMCISGRPRHVGCDWEIDSDAKEDHCGICHGDGTSCKKVVDQFNKTDGLGYESAITIPIGARNIRVEEVAEANNYLAVRNTKGQYFLNGHWFIQWSGDYEAGGTVIHYQRDGNLESFSAPGPLKEPLQIMLLFQSKNPGVTFEYTIPNENMTDMRIPEYLWKYMDWTHCTLSCGGGTQRSEVVCVEREAGIVENRYCNASTKPDDMQRTCNTHLCPARWWAGPWQHCSVTCGNHGIHRRTVICIRSLGPDNQMALEDHECDGEEKPNRIEPCHHKEACPSLAEWRVGDWSETCSGDPCETQIRRVTCSDEVNPQSCDATTMPASERHCTNITCGTWTTGAWSTCSHSCGEGVQFRSVTCTRGVACLQAAEPDAERACHMAAVCGGETAAAAGGEAGSEVIEHNNDVEYNVDELPDEEATSDSSMPEDLVEKDKMSPSDVQDKAQVDVSSNAKENPELLKQKMKWSESKSKENDPVVKNEVNTVPTIENIPKTTEVRTTRQRERRTTPRLPSQPPSTVTMSAPSTETPTPTSVPTTELVPSPDHKWIPLFWQQCSKPCNRGVRVRDVMCINIKTLAEDGDAFCAGHVRPLTQQDCNLEPCLEWTTTDWSQCSSSCGPGSQTRQVSCDVEGLCDADTRPPVIQECSSDCPAAWVSGPWSQCSVSCGEGGEQVRHVQCVDPVTEERATGCDESERPPDTTECHLNKCPQEQNQALTGYGFQCHNNMLSHHVCKALKQMGRCRQKIVMYKCCRTCSSRRRHHPHAHAAAAMYFT